MKNNISKLYQVLALTGVIALTFSCKNAFDIKPNDVLEKDQVYQTLSDADAAVYGVYGKFMSLAEQYVILNELRGDLMDVTFKSNPALKEINNHEVSANNPYANPRKFYELVLACNDVLAHLDQMLGEGKITATDRNERYSDIGCLRSWVYLQLGIHYGKVPYVTSPISNINDLKNEALFPKLEFDQLLDQLIQFTEGLPLHEQYQNGVSTTTLPDGTALAIDGVTLRRIFIYRRLILGNLYLWKNNYTQAAINYREILNDPPVDSPNSSIGNRNVWTVGYNIYAEGSWRNMFSDSFSGSTSISSANSSWEWIWYIPFHALYTPNPFIKLFSYNQGDYQLKPSQLSINNWTNETRSNGTPGDLRGLDASYNMQGSYPVVRKFLGQYDITKPLEKTGIWYLNRAADLHLHIAEAANRDNKHRLAYSLLTYDLKNLYDPVQKGIFYTENTGGRDSNADWPNTGAGSTKRDLRGLQKTPYAYPWNYDGGERDFPGQTRQQFSTHRGIRMRVGTQILRIDSAKFFDMSGGPNWRFVNVETLLKERPVIDQKGLVEDMEDKILQEGALELAFEGHRWADLVRIAKRRNDPSVLAKRVANKFRIAGDLATAGKVEAKLMNMSNWYLPFDFK